MRRTGSVILAASAALFMALLLPLTALADSLYGADGWTVTYTAGDPGKMVMSYPQTEDSNEKTFADSISNLQPGDDITFTVQAIHANDTEADWYLENDIIKSLEEQSANNAAGSSYEYLLTYESPNGDSYSRTLFDSKKVGGDDSEGLNEAADNLEDFIYLDQLKKGQTGKVVLKVTLDGETESDIYFDTFAQVKMRFAVEPVTEKTETKREHRQLVRTGDETELFPFYVAMLVSGLLLLVLAFDSLRLRRKDREGGAR